MYYFDDIVFNALNPLRRTKRGFVLIIKLKQKINLAYFVLSTLTIMT